MAIMPTVRPAPSAAVAQAGIQWGDVLTTTPLPSCCFYLWSRPYLIGKARAIVQNIHAIEST
jgi:hypothetical protein